jgi:sugar/nucleoside kinase (ribokinase family)
VTWEVAVAGTLHSDDLTTPAGRRDTLGGSAVYFSLAAARYAPVHVNGIVGTDTAADFRRILAHQDIDLEGLVESRSPTFRWHAVHDFERWVTAHESSEPGCDPEWQPVLPESSRRAQVLFVGSMDPRVQRAVIDQSTATLIGVDSMTVFIDSRPAEVRSLIEQVDVLFLTAAELAALSGSDDWRSSAATLCGIGRLRAVVVKQGPLGAACVTAGGIAEEPAVPVAQVADPTGAGDALAGGFLGLIAHLERADDAAFAVALAEGTRCAADAIVEFGTAGLHGTRAV